MSTGLDRHLNVAHARIGRLERKVGQVRVAVDPGAERVRERVQLKLIAVLVDGLEQRRRLGRQQDPLQVLGQNGTLVIVEDESAQEARLVADVIVLVVSSMIKKRTIKNRI